METRISDCWDGSDIKSAGHDTGPHTDKWCTQGWPPTYDPPASAPCIQDYKACIIMPGTLHLDDFFKVTCCFNFINANYFKYSWIATHSGCQIKHLKLPKASWVYISSKQWKFVYPMATRYNKTYSLTWWWYMPIISALGRLTQERLWGQFELQQEKKTLFFD